MKKLTKILSMLLVAVMFVSLLGSSAFAGYEIIGGTTAGTTTSDTGTTTGSGYEIIGSGSGYTAPAGSTVTSASGDGYEVIDPSANTNSGTDSNTANGVNIGSGSVTQFNGELTDEKPFYAANNYFATLADAVTAANGGTVILGKSVQLTDAHIAGTISKSFTLNLNNFTLTIGSTIPLTATGIKMTVTGGGANGRIIGSGNFVSLGSSATLTLSNLTVAGPGIEITTGGKVTIESGTYGDGVAQAGVTISSGTFTTTNSPVDDGAALATGKTVTGEAGNWIVAAGTNPSNDGAILNGSRYCDDFADAYSRTTKGVTSTIQLLKTDTSVTGALEIDRNLNLNLDKYSITFGGGVTIKAGTTVNVTGGAIYGDITIEPTARLNLNGGNPAIPGVTNNGTLTVAGGKYTSVGAVTGSGVTNITSGTVESVDLSTGTLSMSGGDSVINTLTIPASTSVGVTVSGGKVKTASVAPYSGARASKPISGGVWGGLDSDAFNSLSTLVNGTLTATTDADVTAPAFKVGSGAGASTGGTTGGGTSGDFSVTPSSSGLYVYNPNASQGSASYPYYITMPSGGRLNSVQYIGSNGMTYDAGATATTSGTIYLNRSYMAALPAGIATVRFNFSGATIDVSSPLYVVPSCVIPTGSGVSLILSDANGGINGTSVYCGNAGSISAGAHLLVAGTDYNATGSDTSQTWTLTSTGLSAINTTGSSSYKAWCVMGGIGFELGSFYLNNNQVIGSTTGSGTNDPYNSSSDGPIYVAPAAGSTWTSGDGDMPFYHTSVTWSLVSARVDGVELNTMNWDTTRKINHFYLDDALLATLSRGEHTVFVTNEKGEYGSCTFNVGPSLVPKDTTKHTIGSRLSLRYVCSDPIYEVFVNNVWVDPANYGLSNDRRTLTIYADFLNARTAGYSYDLTVDIDNDGIGKNGGDADAKSYFTILTTAQAAASPRTGDNSNLALWAALLSISGMAAVVVVPRLKKHED